MMMDDDYSPIDNDLEQTKAGAFCALVLLIISAACWYCGRIPAVAQKIAIQPPPTQVSEDLRACLERAKEGEAFWSERIFPELSDDEFTHMAYRVILRREPDPAHIDLSRGHTRRSMVLELMDSQEFRERVSPKLRGER